MRSSRGEVFEGHVYRLMIMTKLRGYMVFELSVVAFEERACRSLPGGTKTLERIAEA
jgi:hypothetical protein